jgi:hypothetical protein
LGDVLKSTANVKAFRHIMPVSVSALVLILAASLPAGASVPESGPRVGSSVIITHADVTGSISGTVTDAVTNAGVAGICIDAVEETGGSGFGAAATLNDGTYSIANLTPGLYTILVSPTCAQTKVSAYANIYDTVNLVTVVAGAATTGQNYAVIQSGSISGTVTDASTSAGLSGVCVIAGPVDAGTGFAAATSSVNGSFTISNLSPGSYTLVVDPTCYGTIPSTDAKAVSVGAGLVVGAGATTGGANFSLALGGSISGTVTDAVTGGGVAGVCLTLGQSQGGSGFSTAATQSDGTYIATNLAPGTYDVDLSPSCNAPSNYVEEVQTASANVIAGTTTAGENYTLVRTNLKVTTLGGWLGTPLTLRTLGGSGTGTVTFSVTNGSALGCTVKGSSLSATKAGTCLVTATKGADVNYGPVSTPSTAVTMLARPTSARPAIVSLAFTGTSSALSAGARNALMALANKLLPGASLTVTGFAKGNPGLALRRANATARVLKADAHGAIHVTLRAVTSVPKSVVTVATTKN